MYDILELNQKKVAELKDIANELNIKKFEKLKKEDNKWMLFNNLMFYSNDVGLINVPAGFKTDLTSTPEAVWEWLPPDGPYMAAAIIHDYLYSKQSALSITREEADDVFKEAMKSLDVDSNKRKHEFQSCEAYAELYPKIAHAKHSRGSPVLSFCVGLTGLQILLF